VLQQYGEPDAVLHPVPAPGAAHTRLDRAQGLAIGMAGFEAGIHHLAPDLRELVDSSPEHIDALRARDLGIEPVLLGDGAQRYEPLRGDLPARHPRDHGIGAVLLHVGEVMVVGVLEPGVLLLQDVLVPAGGQDRGHGRLADVAAEPLAVLGDDVLEGLVALDPHDVVELLACVGEVLAHALAHRHPQAQQLLVEDLGHERRAAAAGRGALGGLLERPEAVGTVRDGGADPALADVVAGADLGGIGQRIDTEAGGLLSVALRQDQFIGVGGQLDAVETKLQQLAVGLGIAHQHPAQKTPAVLAHHELLVDAVGLVDVGVGTRPDGAAVGVADARDIDARSFNLVLMSAPVKRCSPPVSWETATSAI
jgi:hypothetical protein